MYWQMFEYRRVLAYMKNIIKGVLLCIGIALPAWLGGILIPVVGAPVFSIIIGIGLSFVIKNKGFKPGIQFTSKKILQYSIVLMGFSMSFITVLETGRDSLALILGTLAVALVVGFFVSKAMKLPQNTSILITVGSSICGGSAIAATAPVLQAKDDEISSAISTIFLFNVIAALIFPTIGMSIGLTDTGFGIWAGTAVNDTSSVVAAATTWSQINSSNIALELATIVKLTRTLAIIPITFVLAIYISRQKIKEIKAKGESEEELKNFSLRKIFPWFIIFFLLATTVNTIFPIPDMISDGLVTAGKFMITMAMAAIGLNTDIKKMASNGMKPILLGLICWIAIATSSLLIQYLMGMM